MKIVENIRKKYFHESQMLLIVLAIHALTTQAHFTNLIIYNELGCNILQLKNVSDCLQEKVFSTSFILLLRRK